MLRAAPPLSAQQGLSTVGNFNCLQSPVLPKHKLRHPARGEMLHQGRGGASIHLSELEKTSGGPRSAGYLPIPLSMLTISSSMRCPNVSGAVDIVQLVAVQVQCDLQVHYSSAPDRLHCSGCISPALMWIQLNHSRILPIKLWQTS